MVLQSFGVGFLDPLQNLDDDGREAVGVEVDFLVVGDLAEVARKKPCQQVGLLIVLRDFR